MAAVVVRDLHKRYGDVHAVRGLDLDIEEGEVVALLGPNGAGKTTTVEILEGHRDRTSGHVEVLGTDPEHADRAYKERIGIVLQSAGIEPVLTVREAIELYAPMYPTPLPVERVIEVTGLTEKADARVKTLSGGQQRRLDLALGIIGDPDLIFLDEPTTGFDPSARRRAWDLVANLRSLGKTILLTTHYMDEAEHLADRVVVIAAGTKVAEGTPAQLRAIGDGRTTISFVAVPGVEAAVPELDVRREGEHVVIRTDQPTRTLHLVAGWAVQQGRELEDLTVRRASLEDVYLELTADG